MLDLPIGLAVASWTEQGICLLPPAPDEEIRSTFEVCGRRATEDVLELYRRINGFYDDVYCRNYWSLWPLAKIRDKNQFNPSQNVWFADFFVDSHFYCLAADGPQTSSVHVQYHDAAGFETFKVADNLAEFLHRLLNDPASVHIPSPGDEGPWRRWWRYFKPV